MTQRRRSEAARAMDRVQAVVHAFHELSDEDKDVFLDLVDPLPVEPEPTKKKPKKSSKKPSSKSPRAQSLSGAIQRAGKERVDDGDNDNRCAHRFTDIPGGKTCGSEESSGIHDPKMGYSGYHPFVVPSPAPPALRRSSANGGAGSTTASSVTETEDVSSAVHAGG